MDAQHEAAALIDAALAAAERRLRLGRALRGGAVGGWVGVGVSAVGLIAAKLALVPAFAPAYLLAPVLLGAALGAAAHALRWTADRTELALLVDRLVGTDEAAVTALEVGEEAFAQTVLDDAAHALADPGPALRRELPLKPGRPLQLLPLGLLAVGLLMLLPTRVVAPKPAGPAGDPVAEAERLAERKAELERELKVSLPEELDREVDELVEAMKRGSMDAGEAAKQSEALRKKLAEHARQATAGNEAQRALEHAQDALADVDAEAARDLSDALQDGDLQEAKEAIDRMRDRMERKPEAEREQAAKQLEKMGRKALDLGLPGLGKAMQNEADRARGSKPGRGKQGSGGQGNAGSNQQQGSSGGQSGQSGAGQPKQGQGQGQQGQDGQGQGQGQQGQGQGQQSQGQGQSGQAQGQGQQGSQGAGGQSGQGGQQGSQGQQGSSSGQQGQAGGANGGGQGDQPGQAGGGGGLREYLDQLDQQGMGDGLAEQNKLQELNDSLDQALGGASGRMGGQPGQGGKGQGRGRSQWGAGSGHSDADGGTHQSKQGFQDLDRQVEGRTSDWTVPHKQDFDEQRMQGVDAIAASVDVKLGDGPVDVETMRVSGSDERSGAAIIQAPPGYKAAAEEAIDGEAVPRAYREQVKKYFDAID